MIIAVSVRLAESTEVLKLFPGQFQSLMTQTTTLLLPTTGAPCAALEGNGPDPHPLPQQVTGGSISPIRSHPALLPRAQHKGFQQEISAGNQIPSYALA